MDVDGTPAKEGQQLLYGLIVVIIIFVILLLLTAGGKGYAPPVTKTEACSESGISYPSGVICRPGTANNMKPTYIRYSYLPDTDDDPLRTPPSTCENDGDCSLTGSPDGYWTCGGDGECVNPCGDGGMAYPSCSSNSDCSSSGTDSPYWSCINGICMSATTLAPPAGTPLGTTPNVAESVCISTCGDPGGDYPTCTTYAYEDGGPPVCDPNTQTYSSPLGTCTYYEDVPASIATVATDKTSNPLPRYVGVATSALEQPVGAAN